MFWILALAACAPRVSTGSHHYDGQTAMWSAYVPPDDGREYGAAVLLPADNSTHEWLPRRRALRRWARATHSVLFSLDAPAPGGTGCWWTPQKHRRARFLADAVGAIVVGRFGADPQRIHLGGWSGGAFLALAAPIYTDLEFRGGLVGVCGGDQPRQDTGIDWCEVDEYQDDAPLLLPAEVGRAAALGRRVYVVRNDDDDWVRSVDAGAAFWTEHGADVRLESAGSGGHCALDVVDQFVQGLRWVAAREGT